MLGQGVAQDASDTRFATWQRVEGSDALREYKERLKEAASLDQASRTFLEADALPQLAREENRGSIERVRRRMRDVLLGEIGNQQALAAANGLVADFMDGMARDGTGDPLVRVNAAILIGELRGVDNRPWPDAVPRLAALSADRMLPIGVRIAAMAGLSRANMPVASTPQSAEAVGRALTAILEEPPAAGRPEQDWLAARAVTLLPAVMTEYPEPVAAVVLKLVLDESRSTDLRVRAAASLGARVGPKSVVDPGVAVAAIESIAIRSLAGDLSQVERNRFEQEYRQFVGGKADGQEGRPGSPDGQAGIPEQVVRREAWRLFTLAGSLDGGDGAIASATAGGGKGLAGAAKAGVAEKARALAAALREEALALDGEPTERSLLAVLERLRPTAKKPGTELPEGDRGDGSVAEGDEPPKPRRRGRRNQAEAADQPPQASPFESTPAGT